MLLSIVLNIVVKDNKILLLRRQKGDFVNLLAIPGGKVERDEHVSDAAKREFLEESGMNAEFKEYLGCVSEILKEGEDIKAHFILHLCELIPEGDKIVHSEEGELSWHDLDVLEELKEEIVPSDFEMIKNFVLKKEKQYFDCIEEKRGDKYYITKFL